jgi:hypothetical protein
MMVAPAQVPGILRPGSVNASWRATRRRPVAFPHAIPSMPRLPRALAAVAAVILILSSGAHSFMGWPGLRTELAAANAPDALVDGLAMGWHFAGMTMLVLGILVLWLLVAARSGAPSIRVPLLVIGVAYVLFGIKCAMLVGLDPFPLIFLVPGVLLSVAALLATPGRAEPPR